MKNIAIVDIIFLIVVISSVTSVVSGNAVIVDQMENTASMDTYSQSPLEISVRSGILPGDRAPHILGIHCIVANAGTDVFTNIELHFKVDEGFLITPESFNCGDLEPEHLFIRGFIVFGMGDFTLTVSVTCDEGATASTTVNGSAFGILISIPR